MRIGLVHFLNAAPLDYGIRRSSHDLVESTPSVLAEMLLDDQLDCALISSVECLRNQDHLAWSPSFGVCAKQKVHSVLYIKQKASEARDAKINKLWVDVGSRSSVALWQCLYTSLVSDSKPITLPNIVTAEPKDIPNLIDRQEGGILIGDAALDFSQSSRAQDFALYDLAEWWYEQEKLPFVFALWAYKRREPIEDSFFAKSFAEGQKNLDKILHSYTASTINSTNPSRQEEKTGLTDYLTKVIYYRLGQEEHEGLERFAWRLGISTH